MFEILDQSTEVCLAVRFSGKVTGMEYQQFLVAVRTRLEASEKVSLVCEFVDFDFYGDFESAKEDFKFAFKEYKQIRKAAFVGNQKWIEWFIRFIGSFTKAEEKLFAHDQFEAAFNWAST
jgi:hypothetical protein